MIICHQNFSMDGSSSSRSSWYFVVFCLRYIMEKKMCPLSRVLKRVGKLKKAHQRCCWYEAEREMPSTNTAERWNCESSPSLFYAAMVCVAFPGVYKWGWPWSWYLCAESSVQVVFTSPFLWISRVTSVGSMYRIHSSMPANDKPKRN